MSTIDERQERLVNIQNQRNEIWRDFLKTFKVEGGLNHTVTIIETKWIAISIFFSSVLISIAILVHK